MPQATKFILNSDSYRIGELPTVKLDYLLIVGGGGGGGAGYYYENITLGRAYYGSGGGGGAGGVIYCAGIELPVGTYNIIVGCGGYKCEFTSNDGCGNGCPSCLVGGDVFYCAGGGGIGATLICTNTSRGTRTIQYDGGSGGSGGGGYGGINAYTSTCPTRGGYGGCSVGGGSNGGDGGCAANSCGGGGGGGACSVGSKGNYSSCRGGYGGIGFCPSGFGSYITRIAGGGNGGGLCCYNYKYTGSGSCVYDFGGGYGGARGCNGGDATCYGGGGGGGGYGSQVGTCYCQINIGGRGYPGVVGISYPTACGYNISGGIKCTTGTSTINYFTSNGTLTIN